MFWKLKILQNGKILTRLTHEHLSCSARLNNMFFFLYKQNIEILVYLNFLLRQHHKHNLGCRVVTNKFFVLFFFTSLVLCGELIYQMSCDFSSPSFHQGEEN